MKKKNKDRNSDQEEINEELFTEAGMSSPEKAELAHPAVVYAKRMLKFVGENFNFSPGVIVSGKQIPVSFTLRFPLAKVLKKIKI